MCGELHSETFSQGIRFWRNHDSAPLDGRGDWSMSRPAVDPAGRPVRVLDVPPWAAGHRETIRDLLDEASWDGWDGAGTRSPDKGPAGPAMRGIEFGVDVLGGRDCPVCWRTRGGRLCGQVLLARLTSEDRPGFGRYLLRIAWHLRFVAIGFASEGIAVRAVVPVDDEKWRDLSERALAAAVRHLQSQTAWWTAPAELLAGLFEQCGITVVT